MDHDAEPATDPAAIRAWLGILHGTTPGLVHISSTGNWAGARFADLDAAAEHAAQLDATGPAGVYVRMTTLRPDAPDRGRGSAADSAALSALWADLDIAGPGHKTDEPLPGDEPSARGIIVEAGLPDPSVWIGSGGGLYPIWLLDTPHDVTGDLPATAALSAAWQQVIGAAAARLGLHYGTGVGDLARVLRLPGTVNRKVPDRPKPCRILDGTAARYPLAELRAALANALVAHPPVTPRPPAATRPVPTTTPATGERAGERPGDDYTARTTWPDVLQPRGWRLHYTAGEEAHWTRPGKDTDTSATTNYGGSDRIKVFSDNAGVPTDGTHSRYEFVVYADHGGDFAAATKVLAAAGYGAPPTPRRTGEQINAELLELAGPGARPFDPGPAGDPADLRVVTEGDNGQVWIIDGDANATAAAEHAPEGTTVLRMDGPHGWHHAGIPALELAAVDGRHVIIYVHADPATDHDTYTAAVGLVDACDAEGAQSVKFLRLPAGRQSGLAGILAARPPDTRAGYLARLIDKAKPKPADAKPKPPKQAKTTSQPSPQLDATRPQIIINGDRFWVINQITTALLARWDSTRLFNFGGVIARLRGHKIHAVDKNTFADIIAETAVTVATGKEGDLYPAWPDTQTMGATLSRADHYSPLDKVSRIPFVRADGSICQTPGYDPDSRTVLVLDPALNDIRIPDEPTTVEVLAARKYLLDEWLGDFPFPTEADRANALALVVTPFIRGMVPLVPLAVVDGLQMGSGKNLYADCVAILITGRPADVLPYPSDESEQRKLITSAFGTAQELFVFDEAHHIQGAALARALTAITYQDRVLGVSRIAEYPNRITWMSLGNQVRVEGDVIRRVYQIALKPAGANPQDRPTDSFRHPDLRQWTTEHRAELLTACLTLIRSWFANGRPAATRPVSFGSFESWERTTGGILANAGVPGFLSNMKEFRDESNIEGSFWVAHMKWLYDSFGQREFTTNDVQSQMEVDRACEPPPGLEDCSDKNYPRNLGVAYSKRRDVDMEGYRLVKVKVGHRGRSKWRVAHGNDSDDVDTQSDYRSDDTDTQRDQTGGSGGSGGSYLVAAYAGKTHVALPLDVHAPGHAHVSRVGADNNAPSAPSAPFTLAEGSS